MFNKVYDLNDRSFMVIVSLRQYRIRQCVVTHIVHGFIYGFYR